LADDLHNYEIYLPPYSEQQRIVSKLDKLFERIDKAIALIEENSENTKHLMASVLNEVFEGVAEKEKIVTVREMSDKIQYGYTGKALEKGKWKYLRITDIQNNSVAWNETPYADIAIEEAHKYTLNNGDIVFARTGATAGKSYLFTDEMDSVFASYLIRVVTKKQSVDPNYLWFYFQSPAYWQQVANTVVGAAQPNVNGNKLGDIVFPLPSLKTQNKIVSYFNQLQQKQQTLLSQQQTRLAELKQLKNSLLNSAFKGEL